MKHLKLYENKTNWTYQKLFDRQEEKQSIDDAIWNYCVFKGKIYEDWQTDSYIFKSDGNVLVYATDMNEESHAIYIDGEEFANYLNNPEMFEETEKYNI